MEQRESWSAEPSRMPPGTFASCFILTALTVVVAVFAHQPRIDAVARPLYFALLLGFFHTLGRRCRIVGLPFRLIEIGFLVLTLGFTTGALVRGFGSESTPFTILLLSQCERGSVFLLGLSCISYGIVLWVPALLESQRVLRDEFRRTRGELKLSERARSRMELRIAEADRLHAVSELAVGIAHDMRNPLAICRAASESLERGGRTAEDYAEHGQVIRRNVDRAERTISGLLELGRPRDRCLRPVALDSVLTEVCALVSVEARRRAVILERREPEQIFVETDSKLLVQVTLNLVLNALQASRAGGRVTVRTRVVDAAGSRLAIVAVEDRGSGIRPNDRARLFQPFFSTKAEGTGLGLLSSRRLLSELGGRIGLYPRSRGGARAVVALPGVLAEAPVFGPPARSDLAASGSARSTAD